MHSGFGGRFLWRGLAILCGLALFQLSAPAVRASCGDYVHFNDNQTAASSPASSPRTDPLPAAPAPCKGPHCSHQQPTLPAPVAPAPVESAKQWAWLLSLSPPTLSPLAGCLPAGADHVFRGPGEDIFHPPRS